MWREPTHCQVQELGLACAAPAFAVAGNLRYGVDFTANCSPTAELAILAELLLRGPQSLGELRGHASRMHNLESLEGVQEILKGMMVAQAESQVLVKEVPPPPGSRGQRYVQLLCPTLHRLDVARVEEAPESTPEPGKVEKLEAQVAALNAAVRELAKKLGEGEPRLVD